MKKHSTANAKSQPETPAPVAPESSSPTETLTAGIPVDSLEPTPTPQAPEPESPPALDPSSEQGTDIPANPDTEAKLIARFEIIKQHHALCRVFAQKRLTALDAQLADYSHKQRLNEADAAYAASCHAEKACIEHALANNLY